MIPDFPWFIGKSGMDLTHPTKLCASLGRTAIRSSDYTACCVRQRCFSVSRSISDPASVSWAMALSCQVTECGQGIRRRPRLRRGRVLQIDIERLPQAQPAVHDLWHPRCYEKTFAHYPGPEAEKTSSPPDHPPQKDMR